MCKVLENFTEGKGRNLDLILAIFTRFWLPPEIKPYGATLNY